MSAARKPVVIGWADARLKDAFELLDEVFGTLDPASPAAKNLKIACAATEDADCAIEEAGK